LLNHDEWKVLRYCDGLKSERQKKTGGIKLLFKRHLSRSHSLPVARKMGRWAGLVERLTSPVSAKVA